MESWIRVCLVTGAALAWTAAQADAPSRPLVVELFTAQGCSSCPPADAYLGQLSERPDVLALAFHMDYWDSSGWRDRFELRQGVDRQNVYARNFHRASVFTPQFVIDGRKDAMDTSSIVQALQEPRDAVPVTLAVREGQVVVDVGEKQQGLAPRLAPRLGDREGTRIGVAHLVEGRLGGETGAPEPHPYLRAGSDAGCQLLEGQRELRFEAGHVASVGEEGEPDRRARQFIKHAPRRRPGTHGVIGGESLLPLAECFVGPREDHFNAAEPQ